MRSSISVKAFLAVIGLDHGKSSRLQIVGQQLLQRRLVLDDQDDGLHGLHSWSAQLVAMHHVMNLLGDVGGVVADAPRGSWPRT
ncbi:MAG: hypothetical protein U1E17_04875 [Geminicoccaceae bacterium]